MTCLVFGASGQIGHFLLPRLRAAARSVVAVSRVSRVSQDMVTWVRGCLPDDVPALPEDLRAIVCLGPLDHFSHWLQQAEVVGSPRIVAMSSMSAESKRSSPVAAERELAARLQASEQRLLTRCAELDSACTILRATLIYGGAAGSLEKLAARARRWRMFPCPQGQGLRQPVHADDLARAVRAALDEPDGGGIIPAGGGERLNATAMFTRVHAALAPQSLRVPLPSWMLRATAGVSGRGRGAVARLSSDLLADNTKLVGLLGVEPRAFEPGLPRTR
jgi:nucleoside-diphosphate-sugar epimerase